MNQMAFPVDPPRPEILRKRSLGAAIELCMEIGGKDPKEVTGDLKLDKAQLSRWLSGGEGVVWPKFEALMDYCGNDTPVLWMLHQRGFDLNSVRKLETETERENRMLREEVIALRRVLREQM
ncbi:hypothetical protein [Variovorax sp. GT1P44]|uniref:hypothetical protein n=1 Tax=Variovorax sp. GT1P44 TaxID=3443742 RepID=UPI003F481FA5